MEREILACIKNEDIKYLHSGQISKYIFPMEREEAHKNQISHLIIRIFVISLDLNNEFIYLVQKRGKNKKTFPNYFTDSASGHVKYKKGLNLKDIKQEAKRELEEEFGIPSASLIKFHFYDLLAEENQKNTEISYVFIAQVKSNIALNPNPLELNIKDSRFYTKSELINILQSEKAIDYSKKIWKELINTNLNNIFNHNNKKKNVLNTKNQIALFIGRFQPLHHGHIYVLKKVLKEYKLLKIGIGSAQLSHTKTDPFTSKERIQFLTSALAARKVSSEKYQIFEITDIFNANKWVDFVVSIVGKFDVVFSNSDWVRDLFKKEGYNVGKKNEIFKKKYNGSHIRKLIIKDDKSWKTLVSKEIANIIISLKGPERIRKL